MDASEYQNIFKNEDDHYYYVAVHDAVQQLVHEVLGDRKFVNILDAGCGTGWLASALKHFGQVDAIDMHEEAVKLSMLRGVHATRASIEDIPFPDNTFDLITAIDVIYHRAVRDDSKALQEIFRVLKPGGWLIVRVPAHNALRSSDDKLMHTARRYTVREVEQKLSDCYFQLHKTSYCQASLALPAWIKAKLEAKDPKPTQTTVSPVNPIVNGALRLALKAENKLLQAGVRFPVGTGVLAAARKPIGTKSTLRKFAAAGKLD
ncbi:MAG TPA: methyltransferase domain-containing protein [Candidatus Obscuribacterales bacterium]